MIEPLVALSIALVAAEAFTDRWKQHRWKVATFFGLVHGFAFANALSVLKLSTGGMVKALCGFNLGVELGQLILMCVVVPIVMLANRNPRTRPYVVRILAGAIFCAGMYWFVERALAGLG